MSAAPRRRAGRPAAWLLVCPLLLASAACERGSDAVPVSPPRDTLPPSSGLVTDHVIVVSLDGLRGDAIPRIRPRTLVRLAAQGSHTFRARTIVPSRTLPSHMSMVSGELPEVHGVMHNDDPDETRWAVNVPTIFALAHRRGLRTAAVFSKTKFRQIYERNAIDEAHEPDNVLDLRPAWTTARLAISILEKRRPNLLFIHFGEPDYVGHIAGWMSPPYRWSVRWADRALAKVIVAADRTLGAGNYTLIVTADHGGHRFTHGSDRRSDTTIPWIVWGKGVRGGTPAPAGVRTMDTAATAMWLLGIPRPPDWIGRPVESAFHAPAVSASR